MSLPVSQPLAEPVRARGRRDDCFLGFCRTVNVVTALSCLLCLVAHAMALIVSGPVLSFKEESRVQILRVYGIGIALLLILVETEFPWLLDKMRVLENWIGRASVQGLLALMTFEFATSQGDSDFDKSIRLYRQVAAYCMLGCAGLYALGGCLCLGVLRSVRYRWRAERLRVERDLEQLERQQDELKAILEGYGKD